MMYTIEWMCPTTQEAEEIAHRLIEKKLVACANICPNIISIFPWEGKIERENEVKVSLKTQKEHLDAIFEMIEKHASYEVPAIIAQPIDAGNAAYLKWIENETCE